jgi:hypothetical protein
LADAASNPLAPNSPYIARANHYESLQQKLNQAGDADTYYFESASKLAANLSNMDDVFFGGFSNLSPAVQAYSEKLSQGIADFNDEQFARIVSRKITENGQTLDTRLVTDEQNYVQTQLDALSRSNPALYAAFIRGVNANANVTGPLALLDGMTNADVVTAAARTRKLIGRPIDFARKDDRVAMGQQIISVLRARDQAQRQIDNDLVNAGPTFD